MLLDVSYILRNQGEILNFSKECELDNTLFKKQHMIFTGAVKIEGLVRNIGGVLTLEATITGTYETPCDRCFEKTVQKIDMPVNETYVKSEDVAESKQAEVLADEKIDLVELIIKNVFLQMETKHLCREDCKGICQKCGENLNKAECKCTDDEDWNPQFEILKGLFS